MRWGWIVLALACSAPISSTAQTESPPAYGGFRFGMTVDQALAVNSGLQQVPMVGGDLTLLRGGSRFSIAGLSFSSLLAFRGGHLSTVVFQTGGAVQSGSQCTDALTPVVSTIESTVGALSGAAALNEYGVPESTQQTSLGSILRVYEFETLQHTLGFANQNGPGWISATSRAAPSDRVPPGALLCEVELEFRETAPPTFEVLQTPSAEELAKAALIERPTWRQQSSSDDTELTLPKLRTNSRIDVSVQLDCLVIAGGSLNCVVVEESPPGQWFGEFGLRMSRFYRINETVRGEPTVGRRVRLPIKVTLQ